jgi:RimJ/RimL family protein N-acetyltransferase
MNDDSSLDISPLQLKDIPHLIDCVRRCYGDSYPNEMMYDPIQLKEAIETKVMYSVIARHEDGNVIGHCALTFEGPHNVSPEAGKMLVDPDYRGHHIAESMAQKRIEIAKELGLFGFWTECVTNHPFSQHEMINFGAKETGLLLGTDPASMMQMQGLENHSDTRMSLLAFYLLLKDSNQTIFLPKHHLEFVKSLVETIKMERQILVSTISGHGLTEGSTQIDDVEKIAQISCIHIGKDFNSYIANELKKLESCSMASIYLDLPLNQEAAAHAYVELEKMGFFWGAWIPNYSTKGDILRLQKLNQAVNFDEIVTATPHGENIKKYVQSEWLRVS